MSGVVAPNVPNVTRARGKRIHKSLSYFLFYTHARVTFGTFASLRYAGHPQHGLTAYLARALATTVASVARGVPAGMVTCSFALSVAGFSAAGWHGSSIRDRENGGAA